MSLEHSFEEIERQGFAIIPNVVSSTELAELKSQLEQAVDEDMREFGHLPGKTELLIVEMVRRGAPFVRLLENEVMHKVFSHFLGNTCILYSYTSTFLRPNEKPGPYSIHVDSPRLIPNYHTGAKRHWLTDT